MHKKLTSVFMAVVLAVGLCPTPAFASSLDVASSELQSQPVLQANNTTQDTAERLVNGKWANATQGGDSLDYYFTYKIRIPPCSVLIL